MAAFDEKKLEESVELLETCELEVPTRPIPRPSRKALGFMMIGVLAGYALMNVALGAIPIPRCPNHGEKGGDAVVPMAKAEAQAPHSDALHDILHKVFPDRFQHGVYESDERALSAILSDEPAVASSIIQIVKRQNNSTTTATETSATSTTLTTSTSPDASTTEAPSSSSRRTTTTTDPSITTSTTRTSLTTFTTTDAQGHVSVVTATDYVVVYPDETTSSNGARNSASLQDGAAAHPAVNYAVAGLVGVAAYLNF